MQYVDLVSIGGIAALVVGLSMLAGGLYARRGNRLHTRQGAAVLAGFTALLGAAFIAAGAGLLAFMRA